MNLEILDYEQKGRNINFVVKDHDSGNEVRKRFNLPAYVITSTREEDRKCYLFKGAIEAAKDLLYRELAEGWKSEWYENRNAYEDKAAHAVLKLFT